MTPLTDIFANLSLMTLLTLLREFVKRIILSLKCFQPTSCTQEKYVMIQELFILVILPISLVEHLDARDTLKEANA